MKVQDYLPKETAEKVKIAGLSNGHTQYFGEQIGMIDFRTLTPKQAADLVNQKVPWIKLREEKTEKAQKALPEKQV